jgi:hypothetical protein
MRTIDFSQIFFNALQFSGNDRQNINTETFSQFRDFISYRLREIWESFPWTEATVLTNFNVTTENGVAFFVPPVEADEILGVFSKNPLTTSRLSELDYKIWQDGTVQKVVIANQLADGWFHYRKACPELKGDLFNASTVYFQSSQVYFDSGSGTGTYMPVAGKPHSGNFYECIVQSTISGDSPASAPSKWRKIDIPYNFGTPLAWGSTANWFLSEGMIQEAAAIEQKYEAAREQEYDKATRQQGQVTRMNMIRTY